MQKRPSFVFLILVLLIGLMIGLWFFKGLEKSSGPLISTPNTQNSTHDQNLNATQIPSPKENSVTPSDDFLTAEDSEKVKVLNEIFLSKNDNDSRMDTQLKILSEPLKAEFKKIYSRLPMEKRNERGTLVFLIGRNLKSQADFDFLNSVVSEPECLSLAQCGQSVPEPDPHHEGTTASTLAYPQIVALKAVERLLSEVSKQETPIEIEKKNQALSVIQTAKSSPFHIVAQMAQDLFDRFSK